MIEREMIMTLVRPELRRLADTRNIPHSAAAEAMLLAIGLQESGFVHRDQVVPGKPPGQIGPATGYWQFEKNGGVAGVLRHSRTAEIARDLCDAYQLASLPTAAWEFFAEEAGEELACDFARLLLLTDPAPLPMPLASNCEIAFEMYLRNWRPGAWFNNAEGSAKRVELRERFRLNWLRAVAVVGGSAALAPPPTPGAAWKATVLAKLEALRTEILAMED